MNRLVYLWELDSVRNKGADKTADPVMSDVFKALRYELVKCGNSVAVTMNQLTDSSFFAQVFNDEYAYNSILRLFELGALRVSIFRDKTTNVRTASQYVQNSLDSFKGKENSFVFSNFPIMGTDTPEFKETVTNALKYSDLSELRELSEEKKSTDKELARRIDTIIKFVNIILTLSVSETANVPPKCDGEISGNAEQNTQHSFLIFMRAILAALSEMKSAPECAELYKAHSADIDKAASELTERMRKLNGRADVHKRSAWLFEDKKQIFSGLTEELIHVCYNYTVEDSINGVCANFDKDSIAADLYYRISDYYERAAKQNTESSKKLKEWSKRRRWRELVRFAEYREHTALEYGGKYRDASITDGIKWRGFMFSKCLLALALAGIYGLIFFGVELFTNQLEATFSITLPHRYLSVLVNVIMFGILGSFISFVINLISKMANKNHDVPDFFENTIDSIVHLRDLAVVLIGGKK